METLDLSLSKSRIDMTASDLVGRAVQKLAVQELHLSTAAFVDRQALQARVAASCLTKLVMRDVRGSLPELQFLGAALQLRHLDLHGRWCSASVASLNVKLWASSG